MFQRKSVRFGCGLLFLGMIALAVWLLSGGRNGGRIGSITEGATKVANIGKSNSSYSTHISWISPNEVLVTQINTSARSPFRVRLSDGKRTPLFPPTLTPVFPHSVPRDIAVSPNGRYLLWINRNGKRGGNGIPHVLDLESMSHGGKPVETVWKISGEYRQILWMPDNRHWVNSMIIVTVHDRTNITRNFDLPGLPKTLRWSDAVTAVGGTPSGRVLTFEPQRHKIVYRDPFGSAPPQEYAIPRRNLFPMLLSPDGTRILWADAPDFWAINLLFDPKWRWLTRTRWVAEFLLRQNGADKPTRCYVSRADTGDFHPVFEIGRKDRILNLRWTPDDKIGFTKNGDLYTRPVP